MTCKGILNLRMCFCCLDICIALLIDVTSRRWQGKEQYQELKELLTFNSL